jgi:hypothetical protein
MTAQQAAIQDIKAHIALHWDEDHRDQYNVGVSHVFTRESRKLNKQLSINHLNG